MKKSNMKTLQKQAILPNLDHFTMDDYINVYEPSEDTYLLCDAIENDRENIVSLAKSQGLLKSSLNADNIFKCTNNDLTINKIDNINIDDSVINKDYSALDIDFDKGKFTVLEIGSGSGCVISFISLLLQSEGINYRSLASDINPFAVNATLRTAEANNVKVDSHNTNFVDIFDGSLDTNLDILIFNPPYVPTPNEEVNGTGIEVSWAGGEDGRVVIDVFLPYIKKLLKPTGHCYLVLVDENKPKEISEILKGYSLVTEIIIKRQAYNEGLQIMKISNA